MSRRILHIIDSLDRTGTAKQLMLLTEGLARHGFDVHVGALDRGGALAQALSAAGVSTTVIGRRFKFDPLATVRLRHHIARLRPDVVHAWSQGAAIHADFALNGGGWSRTSGKSVGPRLIVGKYRIDRWKTALSRAFERRLACRVHQFVTNSAAVRDWCVANGLAPEKFTIVPSGVASDTVEGTGGASGTHANRGNNGTQLREELLQDLRLPADAKLIGIVGRLLPEKRVRDLIWAADLLRVLHDNLRVLIIGDGPLRGQLERYARLASDLVHIQFLGQRDDMGKIMPHLDVLWNGSDNVSQSMAILEAMAAGVPVIASDVAVNRELVEEGETGYLIPIGSRAGRAARARWTDRIFTDPQLLTHLAAASWNRVSEQFDAKQMVSTYAQLYL